MKFKIRTIVVIVVLLGFLCVTVTAIASGPVLPRVSHFQGKSLTEWTEIYWRWYYSGVEPSLKGRVKLMPLPVGEYQGGAGTPVSPAYYKGSIEVTLAPGTPFVLPFFAWIAERYDPALEFPDDPMVPNDKIQSLVTNPEGDGPPLVTLDGRRIVRNFWDYYVGPEPFTPIIQYPVPSSYGSIAAIAFQGVTIIVPPLPPGRHELKLLEKYILKDLAGLPTFGVIYDNTWIIRVKQNPK